MDFDKKTAYYIITIALICLLVSLFLPIWHQTNSHNGEPYFSIKVMHDKIIYHYDNDYLGADEEIPLSDMNSSIRSSITSNLYLAIISAVLLFVAMIELFNDYAKSNKRKYSPFLIIATLSTIVTPLYFAYSWTSSLNNIDPDLNGFWGSDSYNDITDVTWGPSIGWYLQIVALILMFVAVYFASYEARKSQTSIQDGSIQNEKNMVLQSSDSVLKLYCYRCGKQIPEDARLCPYCGVEVKK